MVFKYPTMSKEVYLAGTMSNQNGYGISWRKRELAWLADRGEKAFSPPDREHAYLVKYDIPPSLLRTKSSRLPSSVRKKLFNEIRNFDFDQIEFNTKYVVCYYTEDSHGTISELSFAARHKIPVFVVTRKKLPSWSESACTRIFKNFEQLHNFLKVEYNLKRIHKQK